MSISEKTREDFDRVISNLVGKEINFFRVNDYYKLDLTVKIDPDTVLYMTFPGDLCSRHGARPLQENQEILLLGGQGIFGIRYYDFKIPYKGSWNYKPKELQVFPPKSF